VRLAYLANIRVPTEKAHGLQIVQNCEAFAGAGARVTLYAAQRVNTPELRKADPFRYYGVARNFTIRRLPCIDLHPLSAGRFERVAFMVQTLSYTFFMLLWMLFARFEVYYSRDPLTLLVLSVIKPRRRLAYEVHQLYKSGRSRWLQRVVCRRVGLVVAITGTLGERMREYGATNVLIAHDGYRAERFADLPDKAEVRRVLKLPEKAFIVGYAGRLHTMGMGKGIDALIEAVARLNQQGRPITFCLVGGPDEAVQAYRQLWSDCDLPAERLITTGTVPADAIPLYLAAFDVAAMPLPWTEHFAWYTSAIKLFEYMAAGRAILATDLPAVTEVVRHGESALLAKPGDAASLAEGLARLIDDPELRATLAANAARLAPEYTWGRRAEHILSKLRGF
jgi:glycosyltransferase involved in cell wall biosynthesis